MQNAKNFNNLENLLRSAKPADVELPSHKANLRRALMSKPDSALKNNLNKKFSPMKFTLDLSKFAFATVGVVAVAVGGVALYNLINPRPSTTTTANEVSTIYNLSVTDNINRLSELDFSYVSEQITRSGMAKELNLVNYVYSNADIHDYLIVQDYCEYKTGVCFSIPANFAYSYAYHDRYESNENTLSYTGKYSMYGTDGMQDYIRFSILENINLDALNRSISDGVTVKVGTEVIGTYTFEKYTVHSAVDFVSTLYIFKTNKGRIGGIEIGYSRSLSEINSDNEVKVLEDNNYYKTITDNIIKSIKIIYSNDRIYDNESNYYVYIPQLLTNGNTGLESGYVTTTSFIHTGRYGSGFDGMAVMLVRGFDKLIDSPSPADNFEKMGEKFDTGTLMLDVYKYTGSSYPDGTTFYAFSTSNETTSNVAVGIYIVRDQNMNMQDSLGLVNADKSFYEGLANSILFSIRVKELEAATIAVNPSGENYFAVELFDNFNVYFSMLDYLSVLTENEGEENAQYEAILYDKSILSGQILNSSCNEPICAVQFAEGAVTGETMEKTYIKTVILDNPVFSGSSFGTIKVTYSICNGQYIAETERLQPGSRDATIQFRFWLNADKLEQAESDVASIIYGFSFFEHID